MGEGTFGMGRCREARGETAEYEGERKVLQWGCGGTEDRGRETDKESNGQPETESATWSGAGNTEVDQPAQQFSES